MWRRWNDAPERSIQKRAYRQRLTESCCVSWLAISSEKSGCRRRLKPTPTIPLQSTLVHRSIYGLNEHVGGPGARGGSPAAVVIHRGFGRFDLIECPALLFQV